MTPSRPPPVNHSALARVARRGLAHVPHSVVEAVARGVWHGVDVPDLEAAHGPHLADAVCLVERLSYYNVVPQERKKQLLGQARRVRESAQVTDPTDFDAVFLRFLPDLQPLQSRHLPVAAAAWA